MKLLFDLLYERDENSDKDKTNRAWYNMVMLSVAMLLIFSSLRTLVNAMKVLFWEIHLTDPSFDINSDRIIGSTILILILMVSLTPWIVFNSEPRIWLIFFCASVIAYLVQFLHPIKYVTWGTSVLLGITSALCGTAQTYYVSLNPVYGKVNKPSEVFWSIVQASMLVGHLFVYMLFKDDPNEMRLPLKKQDLFYVLLLIMASFGFIFVLFLGTPVSHRNELYDVPWLLVLKIVELFFTKDMLLFIVTFIYNGLQDTFMTGVYGNVVGFTNSFHVDNPLRTASLSGMITGIGYFLGVCVFGYFKEILRFRWFFKIFVFGALLHLISYILIIVNIPNDAVLHPTDKKGLLMCNFDVAIFCSFLQGFGDYCMHTQLYGLLIEKFKDRFTTAIFVNFFITKLSSCVAYFYNSTQLYIVVGILLLMNILGTIAFIFADFNTKLGSADSLDLPQHYTMKY